MILTTVTTFQSIQGPPWPGSRRRPTSWPASRTCSSVRGLAPGWPWRPWPTWPPSWPGSRSSRASRPTSSTCSVLLMVSVLRRYLNQGVLPGRPGLPLDVPGRAARGRVQHRRDRPGALQPRSQDRGLGQLLVPGPAQQEAGPAPAVGGAKWPPGGALGRRRSAKGGGAPAGVVSAAAKMEKIDLNADYVDDTGLAGAAPGQGPLLGSS